MGKVTKHSAKHQDGLESDVARVQAAHRSPTLALPAVPAVLAVPQHTFRNVKLMQISRAQWKTVKAEAKRRRKRLQLAAVGKYRKFPGEIWMPGPADARLPDAARIQDIEQYVFESRAVVYWVDGGRSEQGFLGAGVVSQLGDLSSRAIYPLGRGTGSHLDAEIFAVATALLLAQQEVEDGTSLQLVRIFSDAVSILKPLKNGTCGVLGPLLTKTTALESLYERADWLKNRGIRLQLVWVKGHNMSYGNEGADRAASRAIREQLTSANRNREQRRFMTIYDVPAVFYERGQDWVDEWLWRANFDLYEYPAQKRDAWQLALDNARSTEENTIPNRAIELGGGEEHESESAVLDLYDFVHRYGPDSVAMLNEQINDCEARVQLREMDIDHINREIVHSSRRRQELERELEHKIATHASDQARFRRLTQDRAYVLQRLQAQDNTGPQASGQPEQTRQVKEVRTQLPFTSATNGAALELPKHPAQDTTTATAGEGRNTSALRPEIPEAAHQHDLTAHLAALDTHDASLSPLLTPCPFLIVPTIQALTESISASLTSIEQRHSDIELARRAYEETGTLEDMRMMHALRTAQEREEVRVRKWKRDRIRFWQKKYRGVKLI